LITNCALSFCSLQNSIFALISRRAGLWSNRKTRRNAMPTSFSFGKIQFDLSPGSAMAQARREPEAPFVLGIVADFTGRASRAVSESPATRRPIAVDCDNFEQVMAQRDATMKIPAVIGTEAPVEIRLSSLDDFHPDQLLRNVPSLAKLMELRTRLKNPATAEAAATEVQGLAAASSGEPVTSSAPPASSSESSEDTLARLLGGHPRTASPPPARPPQGGVDINALIKNIAGTGSVASATPRQSAALSTVELEISARLRGILHHPAFQAVEAAWRGLDLLVREYGGDENIKLFLLDVSKAELAADLKAQENLQQTALFKMLREKPWAALILDGVYSESIEDIETLGRIAKVAAALGAPCCAAVGPHVVGCDSFVTHPHPDEWLQPMAKESTEAWVALRALPEASYLGLTLPRVLLRQPYGKSSDPIDSLSFEEYSGEPAHEGYLWGSGAFVCGHVLAGSFRADGWEMGVTGAGELEDLPVHKVVHHGESAVKPCAEAWLSVRAGEKILNHGLMALLSVKGRGAVQIANLQSIANPAKPLSIHRA
jgi:type VI secretion system protein ImpC